MIKFSFSHSVDFLHRYEQQVIIEKLLPAFREMVSKASPSDKQLLGIFSDEFIRELILCRADKLHEKITTIYDNLPILSERYCLEYYLKDINLDSTVTSMSIRKKTDKDRIKAIHEEVIAELEELLNERQSIYLPLIIADIKAATVASEIKKQLSKLNSMKLGNYIFKEKDNIKSLYPQWVNEFYNLFDYDAMSQSFGHDITTNMDLNICLYCNNEDIETIKVPGAEARPDLDHFYPRSKFPFLAITLSNLIPAGTRCNQKYKKAQSMLGYIHPYISGINKDRLFNINYIFDEGRNIDFINITLNTLNNDLDKNLNLFKVEATHNKEDVKNWFLKLEERYNFLINTCPDNLDVILGDNNQIRIMLDVDIERSPKKEQYQKLKIDALNLLSNREFEMVD